MDTSAEYVKMCDCPEIQGQWKPSVGDYVWRKYTIFGEEIDRTIWPEDKRQEVVILHFKSETGYFHAANAAGDCRIFKSVEDIEKVTSIWLPRQDQLQEMGVGGILSIDLVAEYLECTYDLGFEPESWEQLWLALVMREKHGKTWNGEAWT